MKASTGTSKGPWTRRILNAGWRSLDLLRRTHDYEPPHATPLSLTARQLQQRLRRHSLLLRAIKWLSFGRGVLRALPPFLLLFWIWPNLASNKSVIHLAGAWLLCMAVVTGVRAILRDLEGAIHCPRELRRFGDVSSALSAISQSRYILYLRNTTLEVSVQEMEITEFGTVRRSLPRALDDALSMIAQENGLAVVALWSSADANTHPRYQYVHVETGNWQILIRNLAVSAVALVVYLREQTPGVVFEGAFIASDPSLAAKTILLVPSRADLEVWRGNIPAVFASRVLPDDLLQREHLIGLSGRRTATLEMGRWFRDAFRRLQESSHRLPSSPSAGSDLK